MRRYVCKRCLKLQHEIEPYPNLQLSYLIII